MRWPCSWWLLLVTRSALEACTRDALYKLTPLPFFALYRYLLIVVVCIREVYHFVVAGSVMTGPSASSSKPRQIYMPSPRQRIYWQSTFTPWYTRMRCAKPRSLRNSPTNLTLNPVRMMPRSTSWIQCRYAGDCVNVQWYLGHGSGLTAPLSPNFLAVRKLLEGLLFVGKFHPKCKIWGSKSVFCVSKNIPDIGVITVDVTAGTLLLYYCYLATV